MRIATHRGSSLHAPDSSRNALISAYTAGADVLSMVIRLTADGQLVVSSNATTEPRSGEPGVIGQLSLEDLRRHDFSETYRPRDATNFRYYHSVRRMPIVRFPAILEDLPHDVELLVELAVDDATRRDELVRTAVAGLVERGVVARTVLYASDAEALALVRTLIPELRIAIHDETAGPDAKLDRMRELRADGVVVRIDELLAEDKPTAFSERLTAAVTSGSIRLGALVYPARSPAVFTREEYDALSRSPGVWCLATESLLDVPFVRSSFVLVDEPFAGKKLDREHFALGYAKANPYGVVHVDDGVRIEIRPYDQPFEHETAPLERRLEAIETKLTFAAKDWPYYSGGGVGFVPGIRGNFTAEVDYTVERVAQATTLEMAVINVDPGAHRAEPPTTIRDKDSFYDPHGAPPFVGVEHDESDGYRINWNLGVEYDNNQYGPPVGDGTALAGRLRLERRGAYFAAYYRNAVDAHDWVCVGVTRNETLNPTVFLRCAGKRWRQEDPTDPSKFMPVIPNTFVFKNLRITRHL